jgi:ubiquitin C-terminal hydrolase
VFRADIDYSTSNTKRGGGLLIEVSKSFRRVRRRYDLETADECVWVEIPATDNFNFIIIIFLSSIRSIETCYGCYKTESFCLNFFSLLVGIRGSDASHTASPTQSSTSPSRGIPCFN